MNKRMASFLINLFYVVLGVLFLIFNETILGKFQFVLAIAFIVIGAFRILSILLKKKEDNNKKGIVGDVIVGLILLVIGVILLLNVLDNILNIAFGIFFVIIGIYGMFTVKIKYSGWIILLLMNILVIASGALLIVKWTDIIEYIEIIVGVTFVVSGVQGILATFSHEKKKVSKEKQ